MINAFKISKYWIERLVVKETIDNILNDDIFNCIAEEAVLAQESENTILPLLEIQLAEINGKLKNIMTAIENGIFNEHTQKRMTELDKQKADLEIEIAVEKIKQPIITKEQIIFFIERFKGGDVEDRAYRQAIIDIFVNAVFLYDEKIVLTFNYRESARTISLSELSRSDIIGFGTRSGARTPDTLIKSQVLYQLS